MAPEPFKSVATFRPTCAQPLAIRPLSSGLSQYHWPPVFSQPVLGVPSLLPQYHALPSLFHPVLRAGRAGLGGSGVGSGSGSGSGSGDGVGSGEGVGSGIWGVSVNEGAVLRGMVARVCIRAGGLWRSFVCPSVLCSCKSGCGYSAESEQRCETEGAGRL